MYRNWDLKVLISSRNKEAAQVNKKSNNKQIKKAKKIIFKKLKSLLNL